MRTLEAALRGGLHRLPKYTEGYVGTAVNYEYGYMAHGQNLHTL